MKDSNKKTGKPTSNQTSSLARELMARTMEQLAKEDNDPSALRRAKKLRRAMPPAKES